ncbi:MAG: hypothetical protein RIB59_03300 [Rhodospirillales bacterium]
MVFRVVKLMAEISDTGPAFVALAARQRAGLAQAQRQLQVTDPRVADQRADAAARGERSRELRLDRISRDRETAGFESARRLQNENADRVFTRTIDERGNEIRADENRVQSERDIQAQREAQAATELRRRRDARQALSAQEALQAQRDSENALERLADAAFDPSLPRGSLVDIVA